MSETYRLMSEMTKSIYRQTSEKSYPRSPRETFRCISYIKFSVAELRSYNQVEQTENNHDDYKPEIVLRNSFYPDSTQVTGPDFVMKQKRLRLLFYFLNKGH